jgi:hypothetical protein
MFVVLKIFLCELLCYNTVWRTLVAIRQTKWFLHPENNNINMRFQDLQAVYEENLLGIGAQ